MLSLLLVGAGLLGQVTLQEFALALFVGMFTGAYSSLFVAAPLLGWLKSKSPQFARRHGDPDAHLVGDDLRAVVVRGIASARPPTGRRRPDACRQGRRPARRRPRRRWRHPRRRTQVLSHPPRPRKKKRR